MRKIMIRGGKQLSGTVSVPGDKVSSVHVVLASLILEPKTNLEVTNLQLNWDTKRIIDYAVEQGLIHFKQEDGSSFIERTDKILGEDISGFSFSRASITLTGYALLKYGKAIFSLPGGCGFTSRPIDKHVAFLEACGGLVETDVANDRFVATMQKKPTVVKGDCQTKWAPSVGVAANGYLASLSGVPVELDHIAVDNACRAIASLVESCGVNIDIDDKSRKAVAKRNDAEQQKNIKVTLPYDDTVAMTYVMAAVSSRSKIGLENFTPNQQILDLLNDIGVKTEQQGNIVTIDGTNPKMPSKDIVCAAYPELASDIGPMVAGGLATLEEGSATLIDTVYDNRSSHVHDLKLMGYDVSADKNTIHINGRTKEFGSGKIQTLAPDIRAAATTIVAALDANNKSNSIIMDYHQVHRGYEDLFESLVNLGCDIKEIS